MASSNNGKRKEGTAALRGAASNRDLANLLGVREGFVRKWVRHPTFPVHRRPPWSADEVRQIREWRRTDLQENRAETGGNGGEPPAQSLDELGLRQRLRVQEQMERIATLRLEREIKQGKWVRVENVRRGRLKRIRAAKAALQNVPAKVAEMFSDLSEDDRARIEEATGIKIREALTELSKGPNAPTEEGDKTAAQPEVDDGGGEQPQNGF